VPIVLKSGNLNLLVPSGPVQVCNGIALPFLYALCNMQIAYSPKPHYYLSPLTHNGRWCPVWCHFRFSIRIRFEFCIVLLSSI